MGQWLLFERWQKNGKSSKRILMPLSGNVDNGAMRSWFHFWSSKDQSQGTEYPVTPKCKDGACDPKDPPDHHPIKTSWWPLMTVSHERKFHIDSQVEPAGAQIISSPTKPVSRIFLLSFKHQSIFFLIQHLNCLEVIYRIPGLFPSDLDGLYLIYDGPSQSSNHINEIHLWFSVSFKFLNPQNSHIRLNVTFALAPLWEWE